MKPLHQKIRVVFTPDYCGDLRQDVESASVWIVRTDRNQTLAEAVWKSCPRQGNPTLFQFASGFSLAEFAMLIDTIDGHYVCDTHDQPECLVIHGLHEERSWVAEIEKLGWEKLRSEISGETAFRRLASLR